MALLDLSRVTRTLVTLVREVITASPASPAPLVVTSLPPDKLTEDNSVGIYLYHLSEEAAVKNQPWRGRPDTPIRYSPLGLNLHYVVTAFSTATDEHGPYREQQLMGLAVKALHDYPVIDDATELFGVKILDSLLVGDENKLRVSLRHVPVSEAVSYWTAGSHALRLSAYYEVSVVLARDEAGNVRAFPTGENRHRNGILDVTIAPARASAFPSEGTQLSAQEIAERIADKLGYVGTLGVEFFVCRGELVVNEMAPRPHNSGHHTIDACDASQYEQQVRALCGLPLATPRQHSAAVMVNLLGELWYEDGKGHGAYREPDWSVLHAVPGLRLHLYGKHHARPGRKMGHFVVIGDDAAVVLERALAARAAIGIRDE